MKNFKLIPAVTFILVVAAYLGIYSQYNDHTVYENLSMEELRVYASLEENDQIKIIGLPQDSVTVKPDFSEIAKKELPEVSPEAYKAFQDLSTQYTSVSEKLFFFKRLILIAFLFISAYSAFTKKYQYKVQFQKVIFDNVKNALLFTLFAVVALMVTQSTLGTIRAFSQMIQIILGEVVETMKYGLLYSIFIAVFIYFHPQNIEWYQKRMAKKKRNEEKAANK